MSQEFENDREPLMQNPIDVVGGKAFNLYRLAGLSQGRDFEVPDFRVIPIRAQMTQPQLEEIFNSLAKPLAVRSSSPYEDSLGYSFAGRFTSVLGVNDIPSFQRAVSDVLASATDFQVLDYARQHGLPIDDRMAVIVQEMVEPQYSGVCYSSDNPDYPKTVIEYTHGLSHQLMSGDEQGNIVSFDGNFDITKEFIINYDAPELERVARVARELEGVFGQRMDIEFAVSYDRKIHVVQARPITDPVWSEIQIPEIDEHGVLLKADIVRGSGIFRGPAFVFISPKELGRYAMAHNIDVWRLRHEQWSALREFNRNNSDGYCLVTDNLEAHGIIMGNGGLSNMRALVTVDYASRFSHPAKVVSETGAFYLGVVGRKDLLDLIDTGDILSVASDQTKGLVYDLTKPVVEQRRIDLGGVSIIQYQDALRMSLPPYEDVDDRLFVDGAGKIGVKFWDYNEDDGVPTDVFYDIVDNDGNVIRGGRYLANQAIYRFPDFPSLLDDLLSKAKGSN